MASEDLRNKFLSARDAEDLYKEHPRLLNAPGSYCPTCHKEGVYLTEHGVVECDCQLQVQLNKHYLNAGVGMTYQRLDWPDFVGDPEALEQIEGYLKKHDQFALKGLGIVLHGNGFGVGKTLLATLTLKSLIQSGYSCYSTTFASMVEMFTAGWKSREDQATFQRKIVQSEILLLDDVGREYTSKLSETTFDDVMRRRVQHGRPTILTTNKTPKELGVGYGSAVFSILTEASIGVPVKGDDFRPASQERLIDEAKRGIIRPII